MSSEHTDETFGPAFTSSALPQWVFDPATLRILAVNDAAALQYGYTRSELLAMTIVNLHPQDERDAVRSVTAERPGAPPALGGRVWRHQTSRGERLVRMAFCDVTTPGGPGRLVQVVDVTAEARLEREYQNAVARAADACARADSVTRSTDALLATVGHELRQPLNPMQMAVAIMEQHTSGHAVARAREVIKRQIEVLTRLVDDLLDTARAQQGKVTLRQETHDLRRLVEEIVASHFSDVSAHGLVLDTTLPSAPVWASIDVARFHQILSNLLSNAIRHSDTGGRIWVRIEAAGGDGRLVVTDEGHGIEASVLPRVFEPFAQAADGADGGLGIGLSVVRTLVELHGGHVAAANRQSARGAEFIVTLPTALAPVTPVKTFASDLRSVAELVRVRAAGNEDLLDGALEGIETALIIADDRACVLNANRAALNLTGYSEQELETLQVTDILAMNASHAEAHWHEFVEEGRQEGILVLLRKDGARVPVRYCAISNVRPGLHLSALDAL